MEFCKAKPPGPYGHQRMSPSVLSDISSASRSLLAHPPEGGYPAHRPTKNPSHRDEKGFLFSTQQRPTHPVRAVIMTTVVMTVFLYIFLFFYRSDRFERSDRYVSFSSGVHPPLSFGHLPRGRTSPSVLRTPPQGEDNKKGLLVSGKAFSKSLYDYTLPALHGMTTMVMTWVMVIVAFIAVINE